MTERRANGEALEAELARRIDAEARMAEALVALENHPGHRLLSTASLTGQTATRWDAAREILAGLWQDFGTYQAVLTTARTVRASRARLGDRERAQLRRLLQWPSIEVTRRVVSLPECRLTGTAEKIETVTLDQLGARMDDSFRQVSEVMVTCDELHRAFLIGLGPLVERLQAARELTANLFPDGSDPAATAVTTLACRIDDLGRACVTDPLSLAEAPATEELAALDTGLAAVSTQLAELSALREGWEGRLARLAASLDEIDTLREQEAQARQRAQEFIADAGLAAPPNRLPELRNRLAAIKGPAGWSARSVALARLSSAVADAAQEIRIAYQRATGLQERRAELCGRFEAYRAKAVRLGHAEHPDVLALDGDLRRLLWTPPCDLAAATRALAAYQRLVHIANERRTGKSA